MMVTNCLLERSAIGVQQDSLWLTVGTARHFPAFVTVEQHRKQPNGVIPPRSRPAVASGAVRQ